MKAQKCCYASMGSGEAVVLSSRSSIIKKAASARRRGMRSKNVYGLVSLANEQLVTNEIM